MTTIFIPQLLMLTFKTKEELEEYIESKGGDPKKPYEIKKNEDGIGFIFIQK